MRDSTLRQLYEEAATQALRAPNITAANIDPILKSTWQNCAASQAQPSARPRRPNLSDYWDHKRRMPAAKESLQGRLFNVSWTSQLTPALQLRSARRNLHCPLAAWQSIIQYNKYTKSLNRLRREKKQHAEELLAQAQAADSTSSKHQHQPKNPRRSIHRKNKEHGLLNPEQSIQEITKYCTTLYQAPAQRCMQSFHLQQPLNITREEIQPVGSALPIPRKALPKLGTGTSRALAHMPQKHHRRAVSRFFNIASATVAFSSPALRIRPIWPCYLSPKNHQPPHETSVR